MRIDIRHPSPNVKIGHQSGNPITLPFHELLRQILDAHGLDGASVTRSALLATDEGEQAIVTHASGRGVRLAIAILYGETTFELVIGRGVDGGDPAVETERFVKGLPATHASSDTRPFLAWPPKGYELLGRERGAMVWANGRSRLHVHQADRSPKAAADLANQLLGELGVAQTSEAPLVVAGLAGVIVEGRLGDDAVAVCVLDDGAWRYPIVHVGSRDVAIAVAASIRPLPRPKRIVEAAAEALAFWA